MFNVEVVKCSGTDHKVKCLDEVVAALNVARNGGEYRNGQKVTIRGAITDPCSCHLDAAIYLASVGWGNGVDGDSYVVYAQEDEMHELYAGRRR